MRNKKSEVIKNVKPLSNQPEKYAHCRNDIIIT